MDNCENRANTKILSDIERKENIKTNPMGEKGLVRFPSHIEAVESVVKLITKAPSKMFGSENRDYLFIAIVKSTKRKLRFGSKTVCMKMQSNK